MSSGIGDDMPMDGEGMTFERREDPDVLKHIYRDLADIKKDQEYLIAARQEDRGVLRKLEAAVFGIHEPGNKILGLKDIVSENQPVIDSVHGLIKVGRFIAWTLLGAMVMLGVNLIEQGFF